MMQKDRRIHFDPIIAERTSYAPGLVMPRHTDKLSRISITVAGASEERTDDEYADLTTTTLLVKPNDVFHETCFKSKGATILSIQFYDEDLFNQTGRQWAHYNHPLVSTLGMQLWTGLQKVRREAELKKILKQLSATIRFLQTRKQQQARLNTAALILKENTGSPFSIQHLSREVSMHRVYFSRAFKKQYGLSPGSYAKHYRLLKALELLATSGEGLAAIACEAGYADQSHMHRAIKEKTACTPVEIKKYLKA